MLRCHVLPGEAVTLAVVGFRSSSRLLEDDDRRKEAPGPSPVACEKLPTCMPSCTVQNWLKIDACGSASGTAHRRSLHAEIILCASLSTLRPTTAISIAAIVRHTWNAQNGSSKWEFFHTIWDGKLWIWLVGLCACPHFPCHLSFSSFL